MTTATSRPMDPETAAAVRDRLGREIAAQNDAAVWDRVIRLAELEYGAAVRTWQGARRNLFAQREQLRDGGWQADQARRTGFAYGLMRDAERRMIATRNRLRYLDWSRRRDAIAA